MSKTRVFDGKKLRIYVKKPATAPLLETMSLSGQSHFLSPRSARFIDDSEAIADDWGVIGEDLWDSCMHIVPKDAHAHR
ncbi:hypothetical protein [Nesterenkonia populi]